MLKYTFIDKVFTKTIIKKVDNGNSLPRHVNVMKNVQENTIKTNTVAYQRTWIYTKLKNRLRNPIHC